MIISLMALLVPVVAHAQENRMLKRYDEVRSQKSESRVDRVKVWNVHKTKDIRINLVEFNAESPLHSHPDADHSLMVLDGELRVRMGEEKFVIKKGDFISVPKGVPHKYWPVTPKVVVVSMDAPYYDPDKTLKLE